jgi:small subunit ribosomal protein S3Ae
MADQPIAKKGKLLDKWKMKSWYTLVAPEIFEAKELGQVVSSDEANLKNRIIRIGLGDMLGSFSQGTAYTVLYFRVSGVTGKAAHTKFIGHELAPGYIRTLARRRRSIMSQVDDAVTKDGVSVRIKTLCISGLKVSEAVRADVRRTISEAVKTIAKNTEFPLLVQEMVFGKLSSKVFAAVKKIGPLKRVEIRKSEVLEKFA